MLCAGLADIEVSPIFSSIDPISFCKKMGGAIQRQRSRSSLQDDVRIKC